MQLTTPCFTLLLAAYAVLPAVSMPTGQEGQAGQFDWQARTPLTAPRFEAAGAVHEGLVYFLGGFAPGVRATTRCDSYDPETDTWTRLARWPSWWRDSAGASQFPSTTITFRTDRWEPR